MYLIKHAKVDTPEIMLTDIIKGGVTTVVGCIKNGYIESGKAFEAGA